MYLKTFATFAIGFWALAIGVLVYTAEETAPQAPLFGFCAIAGAMFGLGWLNVYIHNRGLARPEVAPIAAPVAPEPNLGDGEITVAFTKLGRRVPSPRVYMTDPCPPEFRTHETVEMVPAKDVAKDLAALYSTAHNRGFGEGFGAGAGFACPDDPPPTNGHDLSEPREG